MRVVHLISEFERGGASRVLLNLCDRHKSFEDYELRAICLGGDSPVAAEARTRGIFVDCLRKKPGRDPKMLRTLIARLRDIAPDIVHTHVFGAGIWGRWVCRRAGLPGCVVHEHSTWAYSSLPRCLLSRLFVSRTEALIAVSDEIGTLARRWGMPEAKTWVVPNGIAPERFRDMPEKRRKAKLGRRIEEKLPLILGVGALEPRKGFDLFLQAADLLLEKGVRAEFAIAGDGPLRDEFEDRARGINARHGFSSARVRLLGEVEDVRPLLAEAALYVCSARTEGTSIALLEAMAAGVPAVATAVGGNVDLAGGAKRMYLVPPENATSLAGAVSALLEMPDTAEILARKAREDALAHFTADRCADAVAEVYERVLEKRRAASRRG